MNSVFVYTKGEADIFFDYAHTGKNNCGDIAYEQLCNDQMIHSYGFISGDPGETYVPFESVMFAIVTPESPAPVEDDLCKRG